MKWQARRVCAPDKMPVEIDRHGSASQGRVSQGEGATEGATAATSRDATGTGHARATERLTPGGGGPGDGQHVGPPPGDVDGDMLVSGGDGAMAPQGQSPTHRQFPSAKQRRAWLRDQKRKGST